MKFTIVAIFLMTFSHQAKADGPVMYGGNEFLETCSNEPITDWCIIYVASALDVMCVTGVGEGYSMVLRKADRADVPLRPFCLPTTVSHRQAFDMVIKHIVDHPEDRHFRMPLLIYGAFYEAFACV